MNRLDALIICGYQDGFEPKDLDPRIDDLMDFLINADLSYQQIHTSADLQDIVNSTEAFYSTHFTSLHTILTLKKDDPLARLEENMFNNNLTFDVFKQSPFLIPIIVKKEHSFRASIRKQIIEGNFEDPKFAPLFFLDIKLSKPFSMYSYVSYAHEICHSQVDSIFGTIKNYHNLEVLSIFLEKLRAYSLGPEVFRNTERIRLFYLGTALQKFYDEYDNSDYTYYVSTLKAEKLFDIFINSSLETQKIILAHIDRIFNGDLYLEKMLDDMDITLENSLNTSSMQRNLTL